MYPTRWIARVNDDHDPGVTALHWVISGPSLLHMTLQSRDINGPVPVLIQQVVDLQVIIISDACI